MKSGLRLLSFAIFCSLCPVRSCNSVVAHSKWAKEGWVISKCTKCMNQKAADAWKKDVWDFQAFAQTLLELQFP